MRGGILIVRSLLWDNGRRGTWRNGRLRLSHNEHVKAPIGYRRRSSTRGDTFTMTFNVSGPPGQAVLAPCAEIIDSVKGLRTEAEELWKAEDPRASVGTIGASWGCVGVLFHRDGAGADLLRQWSEYFRGKKPSAVWPVDQQGILHIPWPAKVTDDAPVDLDLILATATKPEVMAPTVDDIADAWLLPAQPLHPRRLGPGCRRRLNQIR